MAKTSEELNLLHSDPPKLAKYGIGLLINNHTMEAEELFRTNSSNIQMSAGHAFVLFMDALMSFEDEKLDKALTSLRETERKCAADMGWLKSVKHKVLGSNTPTLCDRLETQIILADTQVSIAILTFLQQEFSGYLKGVWILRKAWKIYMQTYSEIVDIYKQKIGEFNLPEPTDFEWKESSTDVNSSRNRPSCVGTSDEEWTIPESNTSPSCHSPNLNGSSNDIDSESIARLMGAVCFGYGVLQLGISLLPPSLLKVSNFFGVQASRSAGISNLMYSRKGTDMRAPLATLCLLWYHTIVRPFYALDGTNVKAGIESANLLMQEARPDYEESALFLFFNGRIHRLDGNIPMALQSFQESTNNSSQRAIKLLALHEVGWCYLIQLDFEQSQKVFLKLKGSSRWSKTFYSYLIIICSGSFGQIEFAEIEKLLNIYKATKKHNQLESYIQRRLKIFPSSEQTLEESTDMYWKLYIYELLYMWNALPNCSYLSLDTIIEDCNEVKFEPMPGLAKLIQGQCFNIIGSYDNAVECLRQGIEIRSKIIPKDDLHVSAYTEFTLGTILLKSPETKEEGLAMLQHCSNYKDYDFDNRLIVRINLALKNVS